MSDGFIAKFLNSKIISEGGNATPLDVIMGQRNDSASTTTSSSMFSWIKSIWNTLSTASSTINSISSTVSSVNSNVNTINTNTARGAVKSIQRGYHKGVWAGGPPDIAITIASVTPAKCMVLLNPARTSGTSTYPSVYTPALKSLTATTLTVTGSMYGSIGASGGEVGFSWQVIEFY